MMARTIQILDRKARAGFTYVPDPPRQDRWRSHANTVTAMKPWSGDCDDLASTVLDLMGRAGLPARHRYRLLVDTQEPGLYDHMAAAALDDDGNLWIVGDVNQPGAVLAPAGLFVRAYNRLDETKADGSPLWRDGAPWA